MPAPEPGGSADDRTATLDEPSALSATRARAPRDRVLEASARVPSRYRVERALGTGASAVVFEAHDTRLDRAVAIKVLDRGGQTGGEALVREARTAAALHHPNVVAIYEADPDACLIVMELASGGTLKHRVASGLLGVSQVVSLGVALADALHAAHSTGILHRDVKPSNVLLARDGTPRLADFGVAQRDEADGLAVGTLAYAAPEQLEGLATAPSDVYGLGATLLYAATGSTPAQLEARGQSAGDEIRARTGAGALARVIAGALERDPRRRPASAAELKRRLAGADPRRRRAVLAALVLLVVAALAGGWAFAREQDRARADALSRASAAVARQDLEAAEDALDECDPDSADAAHLRALVLWWRGADRPAVVAQIDRALALGLAGDRRALLEGIRLLVEDRLDDAVTSFRRLVERRDDRSARYGLFEALWHRGEARGALEIHRTLVRADPDFVLGLEHALNHHLAHGELGEVDRILARSNAVPTAERTLWAARVAIARGEPSEASSLLGEILAEGAESPRASYAARELVGVRLTDGDLEGAERAAAFFRGEVERRLARYAFAILRDHGADEARRELVEAHLEQSTASYVLTVELVAMELGRERPDVGAVLPLLERVRKDDVRTRMIDLLAASFRTDAAALRHARDSTSPEVALAGDALAAEAARELPRAARAWLAAASASNDGTFRAYELHRAAAVHRQLGDHEALIGACGPVVEPTLFHWGAVPLLGACLEWMAEAHAALGHQGDAERLRARADRLAGRTR